MDFGTYSLPIWAHFEEEWKNVFPLGIPPYSHNPQFNAEEGSLVSYGEPTLVSTNMQLEAYHYSPTWSLSIREIIDGSGMPHLENLIIDDPPDFMCQTTFAPSTALGSPVVFDDDNLKFYLDRAGANKTPDTQEGASMIIPANQTYQGTPVSTTSNLVPGPSHLPEVADVPAVVKGPNQEQSRGKPKDLQKARKGFAVVSSVSSRHATGIRRTPKRYSCNICGKRYAQPQGVRRHQRETHRANLCMYCCAFKWGRPYRYKAHLEKEHPHVAAMRH
ncbi:hypothetical protein BC826DRAFT_188278 [Russula brevipes]|nr:hypothetical protein BC826DRAFT_188278 [Russula brevipes]